MSLVASENPLADAPVPVQSEETIKRKRMLAEALMKEGMDYSPIRHPLQGAARLAQALVGGWEARQADQAEEANNNYNADLMKGLMTPEASGTGSVTPAPAASSAPAMLTPNSPAAQGVGLNGGGFNTAVNRTLGFEGGLNPRDTNGSPSNFGINQAANPDVNVRGLSQNDAKTLYKQRYWDAIHGDEIAAKNPALAHVAFDTAVIAGPGKANELLNYANGDPMRLLDARERFQNHLLQSNPQKYGPYAKAWNDRIAGLRSDVGGSNVAGPSGMAGGGNPVQVASNDAAGAFGAAAPSVPASQNGQAARLLAAMADPRLSAQNKQILQLMYQQATKEDTRHKFNAPHMDAQGNYVQEDETGQVHVLSAAQKPVQTTPTREIQNYEYGKKDPAFVEAQKKAPSMDPDTIDFLAERVLAGDNSGLVGLGRGAQGAENIGAVQARVAQLAHERNIDASGMLRNMAHAAGMKAGARTLEQFNAKMGPLEKRVSSAAKYAAELSDKLPRGSFVPLNQLEQLAQSKTSNPELRSLNAAINTLVNEYASATGGGQGTDAGRAHAREMLSMADSPETFRRVIGVMLREVQFAHQAGRDALSEMYNPQGASEAPAGGGDKEIHYDAQGNVVK